MLKPLGIELKDLTITVPGQDTPRTLFEGLNLTVRPGGLAIITGVSGAGKSSLLRAVMGFFKPAHGQILIGNKVLDAVSVWGIRRHMAYVPQEPRLGQGTVEDALKRPFHYNAARGRLYERRQALDVFGELLLDRSHLEAELRDLSGGERQRVALALALMLGRKVLVLDEPTSALDKKSSQAAVEAITNKEGMTVLASSHDEGFMKLADTIIELPLPGGTK